MVCSVLMCKNRSCAWRKQGVSFFKFPLRNSRLLKTWLSNISRPGDWLPSAQSRICSDHFGSECLQKVGARLELKPNSLPTLHLSFRAKDAPPIVLSTEMVSETEEDDMDSLKADHSYSSGDQEPPPPSVEVAMKEHSYFTGIAPTTAPASSGDTHLPEPQEAAEDHTYHSNLPGKLSLDDHTYNRGEHAHVLKTDASLTVTNLATAIAKADQQITKTEESGLNLEGSVETCDGIRNFDHTYNHRKNETSVLANGTCGLDCDLTASIASIVSPSKGVQKRPYPIEFPSRKELLEENHSLKQKLATFEQKSFELSKKLSDATDRVHKLENHVARLKKTLAEVVMDSVEGHLEHGKRGNKCIG
ncbi:hypothetical protein BIW11_09284 [Tropilaelaps mercedesae]|uniref:THAP-type domain-containing protein n=1 Tax=Tropilaelaps mercedesae TaxID=418985 RepID=A0A1V9XKR1_9ACAR|nr:hypothetical protein BIW11_09284 [Tropilaelaps mercedesae]